MTNTLEKEYLLQNPAKIRAMLCRLMESRQLLSLNLDGTEASSNSIIIVVSRDSNLFLLDGVRNPIIDKHVRDGQPFSLTTSLDGVEFRLENLIASGTVGNAETLSYRVKFSEQVYYLQRRQVFRARVPEVAKIGVSLIVPTGGDNKKGMILQDGRISDLSVSGCTVFLSATETNSLIDSESPVVIRMNLQESLEPIELSAMVRHCERTQCTFGFEFTEVSPGQMQRIEQLNVRLQLLERCRCA